MQPTLYTPSPTIKRSLRAYTANGHTFHTVQVQKGLFLMGDDDSPHDGDKPAHWVDIAQDFELGQYPVTQALWEAVMGENPAYFKGADRPVECVTWDGIMGTEQGVAKGNTKAGFLYRLNTLPEIAALNAKDNCYFALPSEAQWEYAARGGHYGIFFSYKYAGSNYLPEVGWYIDNDQWKTQSVGRKLPNVLGLYDMTGNEAEWCEDVLSDNYEDAPKDGSAWIWGKDKHVRVVRGGAWDQDDTIRITHRNADETSNENSFLGFRLARYRTKL